MTVAGHAVETTDLETSDILSLYSGALGASGTVKNNGWGGAGAAVKTLTAYAKDTSKFLIRDQLT